MKPPSEEALSFQGTNSGSLTDCTVFTAHLRAKGTGQASVGLKNSSVLSAADHKNILNDIVNASFTIHELAIQAHTSSDTATLILPPKHPTPTPTLLQTKETLRVEVKTEDNKPAGGVRVRIEPGSYAATTDEDGVVLFENIVKGSYTVYANYDSPDVVQKPVTVERNNQVLLLSISSAKKSGTTGIAKWIILAAFIMPPAFIFARKKLLKPISSNPSGDK